MQKILEYQLEHISVCYETSIYMIAGCNVTMFDLSQLEHVSGHCKTLIDVISGYELTVFSFVGIVQEIDILFDWFVETFARIGGIVLILLVIELLALILLVIQLLASILLVI